jgi:branched-chain amino acid transport system ATP-binding protein
MKRRGQLDLHDVEASYGSSQVLFGVSLGVQPGECITLIGRNGMGKTTTVKSIMGMLRPRAGRITMDGKALVGEASWRAARTGLGLVPEGRQIFPNLSVRENLVATAGNRHQRDQPWTLDAVYAMFPRLKARERNLGANLSGGEQQMLAIGRALMTNPLLLILDEATEGLAPLIVAEIWRVVSLIRESGISALIVDRNYQAVLAHTDRCAVMEKGRIVLAGSSSALAREPAQLAQYLGV